MSPTAEQQAAVERLYENEALIDNLTSEVAQPVLRWAEQQLLAGGAPESVFNAMRAANQNGMQVATALAAAQRALAAAGGTGTVHVATAPPAEEGSTTAGGGSPAPAPVAPTRPTDRRTKTDGASRTRSLRGRLRRFFASAKRKRS